jgi:diguanylate cyclase (GGDEF)-like protein
VFVILSGRANVVGAKEGASQTERILGELGPNEVVGELAVLTGTPRSATVIARDFVSCLEIAGAEFLRLVKTVPGLASPLAQSLARRIVETDRRLERFAPDPLTGLLGRAAFEEQYGRLAALARRRRMGVLLMLLDLTDLKGINDEHGYTVGDEVVRVVARALLETLRQTDLVARYSGDEFALLLADPESEAIELFMRRLERSVQTLAGKRGVVAHIRCTYGAAADSSPPDSIDQLLEQADKDMQTRASPTLLYAPKVGQRGGQPAQGISLETAR